MMAKTCVFLLFFIAAISSKHSTTAKVTTVANLPFQLTSIATKLWPVIEESVLKPKQDSRVAIGRFGNIADMSMWRDLEFFGCKNMDDMIRAIVPCTKDTKDQGLMEEFQVQTNKMDFVCKHSDKLAKMMACTIGNLDCLDYSFPIKEEAKFLEAIQGICKHQKAINCYASIGTQTMSNPLGTCINKDLITEHEFVKSIDDAMDRTFQCRAKNKDEMAKWFHCQQGQRLACLSSETQEKWNSILPTEQRWKEILQFQCDNRDVFDTECGIFNWYVKCVGYQTDAIMAGIERTPCDWVLKIKYCINLFASRCSDEYIRAQKQIIDMIFCGKRYETGKESGSSSNKETGSSSNKETGSASKKYVKVKMNNNSSNKKSEEAAQMSGTGNNKMNLPWLIIWAAYIGNYVAML